MAPLSLKIVKDDGAVTRKVKLDPSLKISEVNSIIQEKFLMPKDVKDYGLFLRSADNELSGIWLEDHRTLSYYVLKNDDRLDYMSKIRNLRVRMLDDTVKTLQVDQSKTVSDLMISICHKIGITNPEEYGLCLDSDEETEESKENKPSSGTLTLKKKSQLRERDLQFEQLSKKLKTDDNVEWVDAHKTLSEACIEPRRTLLLKRRLFYSDRNVDSRDPVQLNLLYVQARDNILNGVHPVTEEKAAEFAGIQCQIDFGDFQEDKHKPGFLENLKEYLPEQYTGSWGIEKKILKEYRKHQGISQIDAKFLYTKTARAMPTYGVTFFLVKEKQQGKNKLIPRLLGINAESILRLDEVTKEILQEWPLTHVKTYHAGKGETFTLNFGDYSDKEYCVKTRDAYRIRDILEGYIDIIRRRMLAAYNTGGGECGLIGEEDTSASRANVIQHVTHNQSQMVEHCIVGPTRIVPYEPGNEASHGTQIVTVQQIITTDKSGNQQKAVKGEVPLRSDMSMTLTRRLNRLNSSAVNVVSALTDHAGNVHDARKMVLAMNDDMPIVTNGVKETIAKQTTENGRKKLEDQLHQLEELMRTLTECTSPEKLDIDESVDAAKNIADLTTQMYFSMDPDIKRQSRLVKSSRQSFIEDERTEKNLRRASFIAATANAINTLDQAVVALNEKYKGPKLTAGQKAETEKSAVDNLAKLNAAIAHYLMAHSDPKNVDYSAAVTSMNTIHEFMPELVNDVRALSSTMDEESRKQMLADLKALCEATNAVCSTVGSEDRHKIKDASKTYSDVSGKLIFAFGRGSGADKRNKDKVLELARDVQSKAEKLVKTASPLSVEDSSVQAASDHLNVASQRLVDQAELTGGTLHEPHCQSALTAAAEAVSSSAQGLTGHCRPLLEGGRQDLADALHHRAMALAQALDALKANYGNDDSDHQNLSPGDRQRLQFIKTASGVKKHLDEAENRLHTPLPSSVDSVEAEQAERRLAEKLAQLNAAMASLVAATSDRENTDYVTAELAINTISELMPGIVEDSKVSSVNKDASSRLAMLENVKALCEATSALCHNDGNDSKASVGDTIDKFKNASGKVIYVVSRRVNPEKEQEIVDLAAGACAMSSELLCGVQQLSEDVGGDVGEQLDARGALLADAAQQLLTLAQMTGACMSDRRCQSVVVSAADKLSAAGQHLAHAYTPLEHNKMHQQRLHQLQQAQVLLEEQLDKLRNACHTASDDLPPSKHATQEKRLRFMKTNSVAQKQMRKAIDELNKPLPAAKPGSSPVPPQQLSERLDALTAALAQLLQATRDAENPDYKTAEDQVKIISELLPQIVQDTKSESISKDAASRAAMLEHIKALCEATSALCQYTDGTNPQQLSDAVCKFSASSGKLTFILSPAKDQNKGQQIVELSAGACAMSSELLCGVQQLSEDVGGDVGEQLDARGALLADAAQQLLTLAQMTGACMSDRRCQSVVVSAADKLSAAGQHLAHAYTPLQHNKMHQQRLYQLQQAQALLEEQLEKLKNACHTASDEVSSTGKPVKPEKSFKIRPAVPKRSSSIGTASDVTKDFLDRLRCEESQAAEDTQKLKFREEKRLHEQFVATVDDVHQNVLKVEQDLKEWCSTPQARTGAGAGAGRGARAGLQRALAQASLHVATLVSANYADKIDYPSASKSTAALPKLITNIVEDGKAESGTMKDSARERFLNDMLQLCHSTVDICEAANNNRQKLNQAAMVFGDNSAKLLYAVSDNVDPDVEKEIISRAKAIGDSASRLALEAATATVGDDVCAAGTHCVDAAGKLVYTAKLVAPSIREFPCQQALLTSAESLSLALQQFSESWSPLATDDNNTQHIQHLSKEADNLNRILEGLKTDVRGGQIIKRREMEKLVVEDTPIRMLTLDIIDGAKQLTTSPELDSPVQKQYEQYWARVSAALHDVDVAHARCNNTPHDAVKLSELEQAIQNLQMILLTSRPNAENQNINIVDLRDFIDEVSSEAHKLADACDSIKVDAYEKKVIQEIKANCEKMSTEAYKLTHPDGEMGYDTTFNDILDVDKFGQDCDEIIKEINISLRGIQDSRVKKQLIIKMLLLTETCNIMRFATKSGISSSKCASLESTLADLDDIEDRVIPTLLKEKADKEHVSLRAPAEGGGRASVVTSVVRAARDVTVTSPRPPVVAYLARCATNLAGEQDRNNLRQHLYKIVRLWKLQTLSASKRLAVWQQLAHPDLARVTELLIQEIQSPESGFGTKDSNSKVLDKNEVNKLLLPGEPKVLASTKQQNEQLAQLCTKLGSMSNGMQACIASPQSLARSSRETVKTSCELAAIARGCKDLKDPLKSEKIEDSVQRMTFATYNLLSVAEQSTSDPNNTNVRRRLQDACRHLNDAISRLVLTSSSAPDLHRECTALSVALQSATPATAGHYRPPPATYNLSDDLSGDVLTEVSGAHTMSYQSATDALQEQQHILDKMNNDQLMCRLEFGKTLSDVSGAVRKSSEYATQCAYLLSVSESDNEVAKSGVVNVPHIERTIAALQDSCINIIGAVDIDAAREETSQLQDRLSELSHSLEQAAGAAGVCGGEARGAAGAVRCNLHNQGEAVTRALKHGDMDNVLKETVQMLDVLNYAYSTIDKCPLLPTADNISKETRDKCDEVINNSKTLVDQTMALVKEVERHDQTETMTWTTFSTSRKKLLEAYDNLLKSIRTNGQRAGILEASVEDEKDDADGQQKTYLEIQVELANKWLMRPMCKENVKTAGYQAVTNIIDIGRKMSEELAGSDREDMRQLVSEVEELLLQCSTTRDVDKYRALSECVKEMRKCITRGVVGRVVEELAHVGPPLEDLDMLTDTEPDPTKRKYILERKIAELLSQLGKVTRTARIVGLNHPDNEQLTESAKQAELLAPKLVQAAERRVNNPNDEEAIERYKALVLEYAESIARVRELCDKSVDPMDFVQTAGDMMQRLRKESTTDNDPQKAAQASQAILRLAQRTVEVSVCSPAGRAEPELAAALAAARARLHAAAPRGARASRLHDLHAATDEIIRTTNDLESALGGENIFDKQPTEFNEKIFSVARELRESVREWSSRDNELVGVARRLAVLMAALSEHMHSDNKKALILTSKKIVMESQEVAELAKKLAHECTDVRIKNNLLQTCERIPTISGQLKMLTTVKASSLGQQGTEEDIAAMDMLVGNAQSLMMSVQEVVKAAAGASVKIMSQRGPRLKWVRKNYY